MMSDEEQRNMAKDVKYLANVQRIEAKIWLFIFLGVLGVVVCLPVVLAIMAAVIKLVFSSL